MFGPMTGKNQALAIKKCGVGAGGVWGTAVAAGATDGIQFLSGQAKRDASVVVDESRGRAFPIDGTAGPVKSEQTFKYNLRYAGFELLAAMLMGTAGAPTIQGVGPAYLHTFKWNTDPFGYMVTIVKNMVTYIEEIPTAKIVGITISGEVGPNPLTIEVETIGINKEVASSINTLATYANVTLPTDADRNPVMFSHLVFRMNSQSGIALAAGDRVYPSKFVLSIKRKLKGEYTGAYRTTGTSPQDLIDEPSNDGFPDMKLILTFPKHTGTANMVDVANDARKKLDITATGSLLNATFYYTHLWQLPHLQMLNANPTDDDGRIKEPLEFNILGCVAAPTGMTGITDPLWWSVTSKRTTDPLA